MMPAAQMPPSTHTLGSLLQGWVDPGPARDVVVTGLSCDSRRVRAGDLFLARSGGKVHAMAFAEQVARAGAVAIVYEPAKVPAVTGLSIPLIALDGLDARLGELASRFYDAPSHGMQVIGVTGTNGKTSVSQFIAQALDTTTGRCGVIGTLGNGLWGDIRSGTHTTPDALATQQMLDDMRSQGAQRIAMEVSSHGLDQGRVTGVRFDIAVWTNLSRDHLDYHGDMASYAAAKRRLFLMPGLRAAVINADDAEGYALLTTGLPHSVKALAYSTDVHLPAQLARDFPHAQVDWVLASDLELTADGLRMQVATPRGSGELRAGVLGRFNAGNLLAALAVLLESGVELDTALARLAAVQTVPGRMERFGDSTQQPLVVVDYAHTPDALTQVLIALRAHCAGNLWCVFGCGGERDTGKRALMGAAAARHADYVVVTDDNPRHEDPIQIVADILSGMANPDAAYLKRARAEAIAFAIGQAKVGDVVLVAGKGHEDYQLIGDRRLDFSDRDTVRAILAGGA